MDSWELLQFIEDIVPRILVIDGKAFLDRGNIGEKRMLSKIAEYSSLAEAQKWINLVPVDDYTSQIVKGWSLDDPNIDSICEVYKRSWINACALAGLDTINIRVNCIVDKDVGDLIFQLEQSG